jgi:pimeloyl-ACP methyl ester carboxylesterase
MPSGSAAKATRVKGGRAKVTHAKVDRDEATARARGALLAEIPVDERRIRAGGIDTAVLEGGDGPPIVLLHGPGEAAVNWRWVIPDLTTTHRVVAPDLPAHGSTGTGGQDLDEGRVLAWLDDVIRQTCSAAPVLVGHVLGGAIAARYAIRHGGRLAHLVLVDSMGLAPFRPSRRFATSFLRFVIRPTERSFERFMDQCAYDVDRLRVAMDDDWVAFVDYNLGLARSPQAKAGGRLFRRVGIPRIPDEDLAGIDVSTCLIWGRDDRALRLPIAEQASGRYGWPLHVIDGSADDPARDQPAAFLRALRTAIHLPEPSTHGPEGSTEKGGVS